MRTLQIAKFYARYHVALKAGALLFAALVLTVAIQTIAPRDFPAGKIVTVEKNMGLSAAADLLYANNIIRSAFLFKIYAILLGGKNHIIAGDYLFAQQESSFHIAYRLVQGAGDIPIVRITIPEGATVKEISNILSRTLPKFDTAGFLSSAQPYEGYLFPDTYFFAITVKSPEIVRTLEETFNRKTASISSQIRASGRSFGDVIKMASIVEKEGLNEKDRRIIAGVLWKRIDAGMALQVDPPFVYILGKSSLSLTRKDLATSSPYNLYVHKGLPPTPIDNPGLDAITDTVNPTKTDYWFYLSDMSGNMHFAATHDQHVANKQKYLP